MIKHRQDQVKRATNVSYPTKQGNLPKLADLGKSGIRIRKKKDLASERASVGRWCIYFTRCLYLICSEPAIYWRQREWFLINSASWPPGCCHRRVTKSILISDVDRQKYFTSGRLESEIERERERTDVIFSGQSIYKPQLGCRLHFDGCPLTRVSRKPSLDHFTR